MGPQGHHTTNNNDIIYTDKNHLCPENTNIVYTIIIIFVSIKTNAMKRMVKYFFFVINEANLVEFDYIAPNYIHGSRQYNQLF